MLCCLLCCSVFYLFAYSSFPPIHVVESVSLVITLPKVSGSKAEMVTPWGEVGTTVLLALCSRRWLGSSYMLMAWTLLVCAWRLPRLFACPGRLILLAWLACLPTPALSGLSPWPSLPTLGDCLGLVSIILNFYFTWVKRHTWVKLHTFPIPYVMPSVTSDECTIKK